MNFNVHQEFKALFALIKATGAEVSPALAMLRVTSDLNAGLVHIKGTKNEKRDRHDAIIEPWALPYLKDHCRDLVGNVPLWPDLTRYRVYDVHQATCEGSGSRSTLFAMLVIRGPYEAGREAKASRPSRNSSYTNRST
jgi:hypothetical protein